MMGFQEPQDALFSYQINLERRVRADNPLRKIREQVDFDWIRADVVHTYGRRGNESVDPVVVLKLLFLLFLDNVKSERELLRIVLERLDYLWFLGYGLDDEIPDHSVLSKARARWGREAFGRFFVKTVAQCVGIGLVDGKKIHMDSSLIDADASRASTVMTSPEMAQALRDAYAVEESKFEVQVNRARPVSKHKINISRTDPDATLVGRNDPKSPSTAFRLRYKSHRVVDDHCGIITAVESTPGHIHDAHCLSSLVEQHNQNSGIKAATVVADRHYGTRENFCHLQQQGITTHMKPLRSKGMTTKLKIFHPSEFIYNPQTDAFRCPGGEYLSKGSYNKSGKGWMYKAKAEICAACSLRENCIQARNAYRSILKPDGYEMLQKGWEQANSLEGRRDQRRRMTLIEGSFGQASQNHHFKRARYRRLWRQSIQDLLIAAVQNIKKLIRYADKGKYSGNPSAFAALIRSQFPFVAIASFYFGIPPLKYAKFRSA